jgi:predicted Zn-dependent protease
LATLRRERVIGPGAALQRARALCDLHRYREAAKLVASVIHGNPRNVHAWCVMAQAQLGQGWNKGGLAAANAAISLAPKSEWPHRLASVALSRMGVHDEAAGEAQAALQAARQMPATLANSAVSLARPRIVTPYGSRTRPYATGRRRAA